MENSRLCKKEWKTHGKAYGKPGTMERTVEKLWKNLIRASLLFLSPFLRSSSCLFPFAVLPQLYHRSYHSADLTTAFTTGLPLFFTQSGFFHSSRPGTRRKKTQTFFSDSFRSVLLERRQVEICQGRDADTRRSEDLLFGTKLQRASIERYT